ncbi:MAG: SH3 domain-containing protein [Oscillospiraceae bacterium]|nr:SH3 domain-containing protein [Oscillospiraceae bacterium]
MEGILPKTLMCNNTMSQFNIRNESLTAAISGINSIMQMENILPKSVINNDILLKSWELDKSALSAITKSFDEVDKLSKVIKLCQNPLVTEQIKCVSQQWEHLDDNFLEELKEFDWNQVEVWQDVLVYDGVEYALEDIGEEVNCQLEEIINVDKSLKKKLEEWSKKYWLIIMFVNILLVIPEIPDKIVFYCNVVNYIQEVSEIAPKLCYTKRECSFIREEPNSRAKKVVLLPYDTSLEIIDKIPRWVKVRYVDEQGNEIVGWISKISVEEDKFILEDI